MSGANWLQLVALVAALLVTVPLLGAYLARVLGSGSAPGDRVFAPVERAIYRLAGVDPGREQPWTVYALSLLAFSVVSVVALFLLQRLQGALPLNPTDVDGVPSALAFNTASSFVTNTNWQNYGGESTMSYLTQMGGLAVQNFVSAAVGIAVAVALVRGLTRARSETIGNFWVDLTRVTVRVLVPISAAIALALVSQGAVQSLRGPVQATTVEGATQSIYRAPVASQEAIKELGTNGGGIANANSAHPYENPTAFTNLIERSRSRSPSRSAGSSETGARAGRSSRPCSSSGSRPPGSRWASSSTATRGSTPASRTWRARRCALAPPRRASSQPPRRAPRPGP
jgi:K+-transporting ATPase ATPase A chain